MGLFIGLGFSLTGTLGTLTCNWNPVEGSVVPRGLCRSFLIYIFYFPLLGSIYLSWFITPWLFKLPFAYFVFPPLILMLLTFSIGTLIGWIFGRFKNK